MKKFNDWLNENELLVEMARIGYADNLEIYVLTDDPGYIPHIHIRDRETKGKVFDTCIKFDSANYFQHGHHDDKLNSKQKKIINDFLHSSPSNGLVSTNFEYAIILWNDNNSKQNVEIKKDENGNVIIPDYTKLP